MSESNSEAEFEQLEAVFRELAVPDSESWARSQVEEGIPQLAIYLFLKLAVASIDGIHDERSLRQVLQRVGHRASIDTLNRLHNTGVASDDILQIVRCALRGYLSEICFLIDDTSSMRFSGWPRNADLERMHWGLFQVTEDGKPGAAMRGLHELIGEFLGPCP